MNCFNCNEPMSIGSPHDMDYLYQFECRCGCIVPVYPNHVIGEEEADRIGEIFGAQESPASHTATAKFYQEYRDGTAEITN